ncbi:hypothetical protein Patl1_15674 [Pistacia atlantica]|uniref:Uncharacterized protein n=1 Tax=Pistacia atlantica TaxID=434234 RepID=A0ACC1B9Y2_9ROSI|nr:hypothetical protein Patl1_15674 [Pistacia atlantica]
MGRQAVAFLIDSGSTHNFFSNKIAQKLGGEKLASSGLCRGVCMMLQGIPITLDLYLLPLKGYDVVLGAQQLSMLGPIM